jgi:hypothetical protein
VANRVASACKAIVGPVCQVAKADLRSVFRSESSKTIEPAARANAASNFHDDKGVVSKAIPVVHAETAETVSARVKHCAVPVKKRSFQTTSVAVAVGG